MTKFLIVLLTVISFNLTAQSIKEANKLHSKGETYFKEKKYDLALKSFSKEVTLRKKLKDSKNESLAEIYLASSFQKLKKHTKAIKHLKNALQNGLRLKDYNVIGTCYGMLSESYRVKGDDLKADEYYTNYQNFEEHVENSHLKKTISSTKKRLKNTQHELEETEDDLEETEEFLEETAKDLLVAETIAETRKMKLSLVNKQKEMQKMQLDKQKMTIANSLIELQNERLIRNSMVGGVVFLILILGMVFYGYRQKKKDNLLIQKQKTKIQDSINYALKIQTAMLPKLSTIKEYLNDTFILYKPVSIVSGDFYFFSDEDKAVYLAAVDCTGHGVPGAMMSMISYNSLSEVISSGETEVNLILDKLHLKIVKALQQENNTNKDGVDIALCRICKKENTIEFSGARNPLVYIQDNELKLLKADKRPVGGVYKKPFQNFTKQTLKIDKPTSFYIFTDGYADQFSGITNKKLYAKNMYKVFQKNQFEPMNRQKELLDEKFEEHRSGHDQIDDVCIIGFRMG